MSLTERTTSNMLKAQGTSCAILLPEDERELRCRSRRLRRVTLVASNLIRMAFKIRDHVVDGHLIMHSNKPRKRDGSFWPSPGKALVMMGLFYSVSR